MASGLLDIGVRRNGYGRQVDSFEGAAFTSRASTERRFPGVFIRAAPRRAHRRRPCHGDARRHPVACDRDGSSRSVFIPELSATCACTEKFVRLVSGK